MNFNFQSNNSYDLHSVQIKEVINLYGVKFKFMVTEKINKDDLIFGDYSHLKTDSSKIYEIFGLPETSESWDSINYNFSEFGMLNVESINLFVHKDSLSFLNFSKNGFDSVMGNLIVLPNNRILEITTFDFQVPGINNLYTEANSKSCFKLTCKTYQNKIIEELGAGDIVAPGSESTEYDTLDNYFNELIDNKNEVDTATEVTPSVVTVVKQPNSNNDQKVSKPLVSKEEDSVWGNF